MKEANRWVELVAAWFVGGFVGRMLGSFCLVDLLGLPRIYGWLSVPIGAAIAWLVVDIKAVVFAVKHAYKWVNSPITREEIAKSLAKDIDLLVGECKEFRSGWGWRIFGSICWGLQVGMWLLAIILPCIWIFFDSMIDARGRYNLENAWGCSFVSMIVLAAIYVVALAGVSKLLETKNWEDFFQASYTNHPRYEATQGFLCLLAYSPVSVVIWGLVALSIATAEVACWLWRIAWKVIGMVNSSQRMAALTGAAIGLSISQIWGYNPVVCGTVCVVAGLVERLVFLLAEKAVLAVKARRALTR